MGFSESCTAFAYGQLINPQNGGKITTVMGKRKNCEKTKNEKLLWKIPKKKFLCNVFACLRQQLEQGTNTVTSRGNGFTPYSQYLNSHEWWLLQQECTNGTSANPEPHRPWFAERGEGRSLPRTEGLCCPQRGNISHTLEHRAWNWAFPSFRGVQAQQLPA